MSIEPTSSTVALYGVTQHSPAEAPAPPPAAKSQSEASATALVPNPRIEFDPKLRLVVMEYRDPGSRQVSCYPSAAAADVEAGEYDVSA